MSCFGREDKNEKDQRIKSKAIDDQLKKDKALYRDTHTLVLLGKLWTKNRCYSFITSVSLPIATTNRLMLAPNTLSNSMYYC